MADTASIQLNKKNSLIITNLPPCTPHELQTICHQYGRTVNCVVRSDVAFVEFEDEKTATSVIPIMHGSMFKGMVLSVHSAAEDHTSLDNGAPTATTAAVGAAPAETTVLDCEIIVMTRENIKYAEYLEAQLKSLGISVDLMFPSATAALKHLLTCIARRGCLCALLITPQHQETECVTVFKLLGTIEEHRDVPLEYGIWLVEGFIVSQRNADSQEVPAPAKIAKLKAHDRHPESIQLLLNLLQEGTPLTLVQYDRYIKYLHKKREEAFRRETGYLCEEDMDFDDVDPIFARELRISKLAAADLTKTPATDAESESPIRSQSGSEKIDELLNNEPILNALDDVMNSGILDDLDGMINNK